VVRPGCGSDTVRIVGACYLQGIMKGETMEWIEKGEVKVESVSII
jgi:hypothetical protein